MRGYVRLYWEEVSPTGARQMQRCSISRYFSEGVFSVQKFSILFTCYYYIFNNKSKFIIPIVLIITLEICLISGERLALFTIILLIFGTISPSLSNNAYAQTDPSILLRIAVQADKQIVNQLDRVYGDQIPNNLQICQIPILSLL